MWYNFEPLSRVQIALILYNKRHSTRVSIGCTYDRLEDRHINDVTVNFFTALLYKTNRVHVALCLFCNRSQKTSKCGKKINDTLASRLVSHVFVLTPFCDFICDLLLNTDTRQHRIYLLSRNHTMICSQNYSLTLADWGPTSPSQSDCTLFISKLFL